MFLAERGSIREKRRNKMELRLSRKKKKEDKKEDEDDSLDLFGDEDTEEKSSPIDEKSEDKDTKKLEIRSIFRKKESLSDELKPKRKIFNFEWWEYIIIIIEIILSIYIILLFVGGFSL
jgi:hypothetical protein